MYKKIPHSAETVLQQKGWLPSGVRVETADIAGAGNMNLVERVRLDNGGSFILKRARPWVEKFPDIPAPVERAGFEAAFYHSVRGTPAGQLMPQHLQYDEVDSLNLLQDLGEGNDGMFVYGGEILPGDDLDALARWVASLHAIKVTSPMRQEFENMAMRRLNALHIFDFPLDPQNGFVLDEITPGLQRLADQLKSDNAYKACVQRAKTRYLDAEGKPNDVLLHGDFYPGSWLATDDGLYIIDPEFCWIGPAEWDIGVLLAHLRLSQQPLEYDQCFINRYGYDLDEVLLKQITGVEIMRRLIGVAQLPLALTLCDKKAMLEYSYDLVMGSAS